jgi:hypothetical protein
MTRRRRANATDGDIPREFAAWFAGEWVVKPGSALPHPFAAGIPPHCAMLPAYWDAWAIAHPGAKPPAGFEWLADPASPRRRVPGWQIDEARRQLKLPPRADAVPAPWGMGMTGRSEQ